MNLTTGSKERIWAKRASESNAISGLDKLSLLSLLHSTQEKRDLIWGLAHVGAAVGILGATFRSINGYEFAAVIDLVSVGVICGIAWINHRRVQPRIDQVSQELRLREERNRAVLNYWS